MTTSGAREATSAAAAPLTLPASALHDPGSRSVFRLADTAARPPPIGSALSADPTVGPRPPRPAPRTTERPPATCRPAAEHGRGAAAGAEEPRAPQTRM